MFKVAFCLLLLNEYGDKLMMMMMMMTAMGRLLLLQLASLCTATTITPPSNDTVPTRALIEHESPPPQYSW